MSGKKIDMTMFNINKRRYVDETMTMRKILTAYAAIKMPVDLQIVNRSFLRNKVIKIIGKDVITLDEEFEMAILISQVLGVRKHRPVVIPQGVDE